MHRLSGYDHAERSTLERNILAEMQTMAAQSIAMADADGMRASPLA
jgi:hypothetical protein